ncbi:hypothetical protein BH11MYX1_BH11MYX1_00170 [soil metagenome]
MTSITGKVPVRCPACSAEHEAVVVQSINAHTDTAVKASLLAGELNVLACHCGKRTPLAATILYSDPDHEFYCQVVPDPAGLSKAAASFRASGAQGTQRIVRTQNELIEKIKILEAGLADWTIELIKVGAPSPSGATGMMLFDRADEAELHFVVVERVVRGLAIPRAAYDELAQRQPPTELVIDRGWALASLPN